LQEPASIFSSQFTLSTSFILEALVLVFLLFASGFVSAAETAFFAISPAQFFELAKSNSTREKLVYILLEKPKRLLGTLLIGVNFVNIGIVVLSSLLLQEIFDFSHNPLVGFLIQVVAVTFVIVLFCEVMPKVYATQSPLRSSLRSVYIIYGLNKILKPLSSLLVLSTSIVDKRIGQKGYDVSVDELTHAIDITSDKSTPEDEKKILKGIAQFGNIDVKQIMKPRMDVIAFDKNLKFSELFPLILEHRYSRIPVYEGSFDKVVGILFLKDLLQHLNKKNDDGFDWLPLLRPAYFVPESKKINDLLQEFQETKNHLAIVVDEYGGSSGIVTLEDVLEEIVGEINDEFDEDEMFYSKLDDYNFVFEGKTNLNDICRVMEVDRKLLETDIENVDTLAGLMLAIKGGIPLLNEVLMLNDVRFTIESADRRRVKRVKITLPEKTSPDDTNTEGFTGMSSMLVLAAMALFALLTGCEEAHVPKQRGYFRIALPEKQYEQYDAASCPIHFEKPVYSIVVRDTNAIAEPCWFNVEFPGFNGTLYLSYKPVHDDLNKFIEDSRAMSMKHISKATGIQEYGISYPEKKVYGLYYNIKGNTATSLQFYVTDSVNHFLRGSLYFYEKPNPDSIAPVQQFIDEDVMHLIETFSWEK